MAASWQCHGLTSTYDQKGAGPRGIKISDITEKNLEPKILELVNNPAFKQRSEAIASHMKSEDLTEELYMEIVRS
jgi:UDP:flavonoid glycosyltransferase YjiC (YdhE family)